MTKRPTTPGEIRLAIQQHGLRQTMHQAAHGKGAEMADARHLISQFALKVLRPSILERCNRMGLDRSDVESLYSDLVMTVFETYEVDTEQDLVKLLSRGLVNRVIDARRHLMGRSGRARVFVEYDPDKREGHVANGTAVSDLGTDEGQVQANPESLLNSASQAVALHRALILVAARGPILYRQVSALHLCVLNGMAAEEVCHHPDYVSAAAEAGPPGKCSADLVRQDVVRAKKALRECLALQQFVSEQKGGRR